MRFVGGYWQGATAANQTAFFDNIYLKIASGNSPTKLAITSITPTPATAGTAFNVTVQAQDNSNTPANVVASTGISLANAGGGIISGNTGTINAGANTVTLTGVTLSSAATGVTLTAARTSGDVLTASAPSSAFNVLAAEPTAQPTAFVRNIAGLSTTGMAIGWTAATGAPDGYIVLRTTAAGSTFPNTPPVDGTSYTAGDVLGNATIVYVGSNVSASVTGLAAGSQYSYAIYSYNGNPSNATVNYRTTTPLQGQAFTLASEPVAHSNVFSVSTYAATTVTFNIQALSGITNANGYNILYKAGAAAPVTLPTDGAAFATSGDATLGASTTTTGATTLHVTGLTAGTQYTFLLVPYGISSSNDATRNYKTDGTIPTVTFTLPNFSSDVITAGGESATISSLTNTPVVSSSTDGAQVWRFTIRDGGATATDGDGLPTIVTGFTIARINSSIDYLAAIQSVGLFTDGGTFVANASSISATNIVFNGLNIIIPNNSSSTYRIRLSLKTDLGAERTLIDGKDFGFSISNTNITAVTDGTSSRFASFSAAQSTDAQNVVDVVASRLVFGQQPTATGLTAQMSPAVTVFAQDANGNRDLGFTGSVSITSTGFLSGSPVAVTATAGVASFVSLVHTAVGTALTLTAASTGLTSATSNAFNIVNSAVVIAGWDFSALPGGTGNFGPSPLTVTNSNPNVTVTGLTRGAGVTSSGSGAANAWGGDGWNTADFAAALAGSKFVSFSITVNTDYALSLNSIQAYNIRRSTSGPTNGQWQYQINNGSFVNIGSVVNWGSNTAAAGNTQATINLAAIPALQNLPENTTVTFRIVNWGASASGGTWYLNDPEDDVADDFVIDGFIVSTTNTWQGGNSGLWNNAANWTLGLPESNQDILINQGFPILNTHFTVDAGFTFTISSNGALEIAAGRTLTIAGAADFGNRPVILRSTSAGTAAIGQITGSLTNATNVTVERFIPARRAWRMLTTPLLSAAANVSVFSQWQNNGSTAVSGGVAIWSNSFGSGTTATSSNTGMISGGTGTSMLRFQGGNWVSVDNTNNATLYNNTGNHSYAVFVTGPFASNNISGAAQATTLRATGTLRTGMITMGGLSNEQFHMIGNPYAATISFNSLGLDNLQEGFYLWDPNRAGINNVGAYVYWDKDLNNWVPAGEAPVGSGNSAGLIPSGQAFFVRAAGGTGELSFTEAAKSTNTTVGGFRVTAPDTRMAINLHRISNNTPELRDGVLALFKPGANADVDVNDARKLSNFGENIALVRNGADLTLERRPPVTGTDTLFLRMWNIAQANYQLAINPEYFNLSPDVTAVLQDAFLGTETVLPVTAPVNIDFTVTSNAASSGNRFRIVFRTNIITSVRDLNAESGYRVYPNPVSSGGQLSVQFRNQAAGKYTVTVFNMLGMQVQQQVVSHGGGTSVQTLPLKEGLPAGTYVAEITGAGGKRQQVKLQVQ